MDGGSEYLCIHSMITLLPDLRQSRETRALPEQGRFVGAGPFAIGQKLQRSLVLSKLS